MLRFVFHSIAGKLFLKSAGFNYLLARLQLNSDSHRQRALLQFTLLFTWSATFEDSEKGECCSKHNPAINAELYSEIATRMVYAFTHIQD